MTPQTEPKPPVAILDSDRERAQRFATLVQFLGYPAHVLATAAQLSQSSADQSDLLAVFIAAEAGRAYVDDALRRVEARPTGAARYLIAGGVGAAPPPGRIDGVVAQDPSYRELLARLQEAVIHHRHGRGGRSDPSIMLYQQLVGDGEAVAGVRQLVRQVAPTEASVLVTGESGTGKEVVARCLHALSPRAQAPFVPVNCGAIPGELLESELFGHEKGAFTGAISMRQGRFEIARGGTLFLDEIGDMPLDMQVKLLRVLQERSFERVGSHKPIDCDVRIVAATHCDLERRVAEGAFRLDLYYRLNVFPIDIAPLRERAGDVPLLIESCIDRLEREQRGTLRLSDCAVACLSRYHWPGNVRELFNVLERLAILHPGKQVKWRDLPDKFRANFELFDERADAAARGAGPAGPDTWTVDLPREGIDLKPHLAHIERHLMTQALMQSEWVVARAAKLLNLQRTTLVEKMRKFEIQRPEELTGS